MPCRISDYPVTQVAYDLKKWKSNSFNVVGGGRKWRRVSHRPSDWRGRGSYLLHFEQGREEEGVK